MRRNWRSVYSSLTCYAIHSAHASLIGPERGSRSGGGGRVLWGNDLGMEEVSLAGLVEEAFVQPDGVVQRATTGGQEAVQTDDLGRPTQYLVLGHPATLQGWEEAPLEVVQRGNTEARHNVVAKDDGHHKGLTVTRHSGTKRGSKMNNFVDTIINLGIV